MIHVRDAERASAAARITMIRFSPATPAALHAVMPGRRRVVTPVYYAARTRRVSGQLVRSRRCDLRCPPQR